MPKLMKRGKNMNDRQDSVIEKIRENKLDENDTFKFSCNQCGECCRNRHDILLPPHDIYQIAKYLKMTNSEVARKYCDCFIGQTSQIPLIRAKPKVFNYVCPFLKKGKCSIHEAKPAVCALFPLGRAIDPNGDIRYFYSGACNCANQTEVSLKEWLERFKLKDSEEPAKLWGQFVSKISTAKMRIKGSQEKETAFNYIFCMMIYLNYRTDMDFIPQFKKNAESVSLAFERIYGKSPDKLLKNLKFGGLSDFDMS